MLTIKSPSQRINLTNQIQIYKNYNQHRKRLGITRYKSPLSLKKSLSFDQQKSFLFHDLKSRKTYTNDFIKKQQSRKQQQNDAKMLRKILQYDRKMFVFSMNQDSSLSPSPSLLHHNSRVTHSKIFNKIDTQNERIHFRITKAKSMYSREQLKTFRQLPSATTFQMLKREHSETKYKPSRNGGNERNEKRNGKLYTQTHPENEEEENHYNDGVIINKIPQLTQARRIRDDMMRVQTSASRLSEGEGKLMKLSAGKMITFSSNMMCDRIRKERLASKLYERKLRFQNTVKSTFQRRKWDK